MLQTLTPGSQTAAPTDSAESIRRVAIVRGAGGAPRLSSHLLFVHGCELIIEHAGREYRLRLTRNDKLILTA